MVNTKSIDYSSLETIFCFLSGLLIIKLNVLVV